MEIVERNKGILFGEEDMETLLVLKDFPVHMMAEGHSDPTEDRTLDLEYQISPLSGMLQIRTLVSPDILYQNAHFQTGHVGVWKKHNEALAQLIAESNPNFIYEIGGGSGILEKTYRDQCHSKTKWMILEPLPDPVSGCTAEFIRGFFPEDFQYPENEEGGVLVHSNVIEHMYEPHLFFQTVSDQLPEEGSMIFSQPDNDHLLGRSCTTFMNFEHNYFCSEVYTDFFLNKYGFQIVQKIHWGEGHSLFYHVKKQTTCSKASKHGLKPGLYEKYKALFSSYVDCHQAMVARWNEMIKKTSVPVYLFGAHISAQYYQAFGLEIERIRAVLDNNPEKQGKRVAGLPLETKSPQILKGIGKAIVIMAKSAYSEEIMKEILEQINPNIQFLE